jgi:hypothetical protein
MTKIHYLAGSVTAGYSGYVVYYSCNDQSNVSIWMIPGTWELDWDNQ